ncbi:MAG: putative diguanylate cyclase YcdT [Tenericutes bacterium ADurb.Bin239]|nr:MAG: putative diguanylate cyclase YcdT [Tenericutes bacterium ADurb.Bin239]
MCCRNVHVNFTSVEEKRDCYKKMEIVLKLDVKTMIGVLICGNLVLAFLTLRYYLYNESDHEKNLIRRFGIAKILQAIAWLFLFFRGNISDIFSIYFGNILLFISFYLDSLIVLHLNKKPEKIWFILQTILLAIAIILFVVFELIFDSGNIRVGIASLGIFCIFVIPNLLSIANKLSTRFEKFISFISLVFLLLLLMRALNSLFDSNVSLFTNNFFQIGTFLALVLLMLVNGTGFLLVIYDRSYELLRASSNLDPLTRIYNRRFFMNKAESHYQRALKDQSSLTFLFLDIDFFKKVNDTYGHLFGDEVLKVVAKVLSENIRPVDLCCRYGGEEFLIYLHETNKEEAISVANRIREKIQNLVFADNQEYKCTISVGIYSAQPDSTKNLQFFIDNADQALYMAKEAGRNCVVSL